MDVIHTVAELRARLAGEKSVVLVPTMGNLHAGHLALVEEARRHGACIVASLFVNRLQFEPGGDFDRYPRTLADDCAKLERAGCQCDLHVEDGLWHVYVLYGVPEAKEAIREIARRLEGRRP